MLSPVAIHNVSHVAIGVRDMDRMPRLYRGVVGLEVRFDGIEEFRGADGKPGVKRRGAYLRRSDDPHAPFLVLDERQDLEAPGGSKDLYDVGIHHFGFWVQDVNVIVERARAVGVEFVYGPADSDTSTFGEPAGGTIRFALMRDPEGNVVQLDQRVTS
jgi:catechol 2,3-dioxygenase-like lactoylglutathione lyase family enzyme